MEELRFSLSEMQKFKVLTLCLVPVGNILIAPIFFNPRRFWPTMLWDYKNHIKYREQENLERNVFQDNLLGGNNSLQSVVVSVSKSLNSPLRLNSLCQDAFSDMGSFSLSSLKREQIEQLAACHNLCSFSFIYTCSPTSLLVKWLTIRSQELLADDHMLLAEGDMDKLSNKEVIDACLRRGILTQGVYAKLVLETGAEDEDDDGGGNENVDTSEEDIAQLMASNWDVDVLRERLRQWVGVVSSVESLSSPHCHSTSSLYMHASALGLFVQK